MTIAVTAQQSFTRPGFSAQFLHSQTGGIFEHNVGYTTQHHPYLTIPECTRSPHRGWSSAGPAGHTSSGVRKFHA